MYTCANRLVNPYMLYKNMLVFHWHLTVEIFLRLKSAACWRRIWQRSISDTTARIIHWRVVPWCHLYHPPLCCGSGLSACSIAGYERGDPAKKSQPRVEHMLCILSLPRSNQWHTKLAEIILATSGASCSFRLQPGGWQVWSQLWGRISEGRKTSIPYRKF